jgi:arginyl-tRNA synthetase
VNEGSLSSEVLDVRIEIADPKNPEHGDFACNWAMMATKFAGKNPRELGELLAGRLGECDGVQSVEVAGPGFINLRLNPEFVASYLESVLAGGENGLARASQVENPKRINVEFVSVNPNGPITIGSGRGAAYGSTLCNVLEAVGNTVHREYYINDGVNSEQMRQFALSVQALVRGEAVPEKGYKGDYVQEVANQIGVKDQTVEWYQEKSQELMLEAQRTALTAFGVEYDTWFSEQSLHNAGVVAAEIESLHAKGIADTECVRTKLKLAKGNRVEDVLREAQGGDVDDEGNTLESSGGDAETLWLRSAKLGDDMDRVLRRKDGRLTYIASDVAYHKDKFNRPANGDKLITILGPDHHGYIGRLTAVVAAMLLEPSGAGEPCSDEIDAKLFRDQAEKLACENALAEARERLDVQIYQLVRFVKDGKPAPMRKRDGNIYALIDLMREIGQKISPDGSESEQLSAGKDVARFFYLMRSHDTTFDFDLDLAEKQSDENPVFYVQYAHARICSILAKATEFSGNADFNLLSDPREKNLIKKIVDLPDEVRRASEDYGVHRIATYAIELARIYHAFYDGCKVIQPDNVELSKARVKLCVGTRIALKATLNLLGVSAPERM